MSTKITPSNCNDLIGTEEYWNESQQGSVSNKAVAWQVVYNYCLQNGMPKLPHPASGIETVITFIDNLLKNQK